MISNPDDSANETDPTLTPMLETLRNSEGRYRSVVEHLGEGMFVAKNNRIVFSNRQASEIMRIPNEDMLGADPVDWIHPDDQAAVLELRSKLANQEATHSSYELRHIGRDGIVRWLNVRPKPVDWEGGLATLTFFSEITDRKAMEQALQQSKDRYRAVIEHVDSGMVVLQGDRLVYANRRAAEIVRMSRQEILDVGFLHSVHPDDHALILDRRRRRLAGETVPNRYEVRLLYPDQTICWIELGVSVVPWDGQPATITFFSDVTARKNMTLALFRSEERYKAVIEHSSEGMVVVQSGKVVFANQRAATLLQMSSQEIINQGFAHLVDPQERRALLDRVLHVEIQAPETPRFECRMHLSNESLRIFDVGLTVVPWDNEHANLLFFSDITERKNAEENLKRTSSEREAVLQSALVGIVLSVNRRHQWFNDKFSEMLGYQRDELIGQDSRLLYQDLAAWESIGHQQREALVRFGTFTNERQLKRKNGEIFWVEMSGKCVRENDPDSGVIWTLLDVTKRRQAEQDTRDALEQQRELNDLRSRFVAMTSHEFRTPLATILSSAELLKYYGERLPKSETQEILKTIEEGVHRMTRMLDRVLLLGKVEAQMLEFNPARLHLHDFCQSLLDEAATQHPQSQCELVADFTEVPEVGIFDDKLLRHIFSNLLSNAIKYSPHGGRVLFRVASEGDRTAFEVSDEGIGIPVDELPHLFESFHRASNVGDIQGTGLGLAIVKNAVELHKGSISVTSGAGQPTCFKVVV